MREKKRRRVKEKAQVGPLSSSRRQSLAQEGRNQYQHLIDPLEQSPFKPLPHLYRKEDHPEHEFRSAQARVAMEISERLLNPALPNVAELHADSVSGKTHAVGCTTITFAGMCQRTPSKRGRTLVLNCNYKGIDNDQREDFGCYHNDGFVFSYASHMNSLMETLDEHGFASVMISLRGLSIALAGSPASNKNLCFADLDDDDFDSLQSVMEALCEMPKLTDIVDRCRITNVLVVIDEFQYVLSQKSGNLCRVLANHSKLSQCAWLSRRYNFYVIGMSATPFDKRDCPLRTHMQNRLTFATLEVWGDPNKRVEEAVLAEAENKITVKYTDEENAQGKSILSWCRSSSFDSTACDTHVQRTNWICDPDDSHVLEKFAFMIVLNSLMPVTSKSKFFDDFEKHWVLEDGRVIGFSNTVRAKCSEGIHGVVSARLSDAVAKDMVVDIDVASFFRGQIKNNPGNANLKKFGVLNVVSPQRVQMQRVSNILRNVDSNGRVKPVFTPVMHYNCVLVAVECNGSYDMSHARSAAASIEENPRAKSVVFDFTDMDRNEMKNEIKNKVAPTFYENKKQVLILVRTDSTTGANLFGHLITACVYFGENAYRRKQAFNRCGRCPVPKTGMVVPSESVGYGHHAVRSTWSSYAVKEQSGTLASVKNLHWWSNERVDSMENHDAEALHNFCKYAFKLTDAAHQASSVAGQYPKMRINGFHNLYQAFVKFKTERDKNSGVWKSLFTRHVNMICNARGIGDSNVYDEDDD